MSTIEITVHEIDVHLTTPELPDADLTTTEIHVDDDEILVFSTTPQMPEADLTTIEYDLETEEITVRYVQRGVNR